MASQTKRDRAIAIACCGVALGALVPVAMYQTGTIARLPDPPEDIFDSEKIVTSRGAFPLGIPDAFLGLASYGGTLLLLSLEKPSSPVIRRILRAKLVADGSIATFNFCKQVKRFGKLCSWCTATAIATAGVVYFGRRSAEAH